MTPYDPKTKRDTNLVVHYGSREPIQRMVCHFHAVESLKVKSLTCFFALAREKIRIYKF
jgi:hypothetical protein